MAAPSLAHSHLVPQAITAVAKRVDGVQSGAVLRMLGCVQLAWHTYMQQHTSHHIPGTTSMPTYLH